MWHELSHDLCICSSKILTKLPYGISMKTKSSKHVDWNPCLNSSLSLKTNYHDLTHWLSMVLAPFINYHSCLFFETPNQEDIDICKCERGYFYECQDHINPGWEKVYFCHLGCLKIDGKSITLELHDLSIHLDYCSYPLMVKFVGHFNSNKQRF